jgi:hypothetical protein
MRHAGDQGEVGSNHLRPLSKGEKAIGAPLDDDKEEEVDGPAGMVA